MKKNYEIKCPLKNFKKTKELILSLGRFSEYDETQVDIYYKVSSGRLKLRIINNSDCSLIFYNRGEKTNKRVSKYIISKTKDIKELDAILRNQFKVLAIVHKKRKIFILNNVRVHLDKVKNLGRFLEIEIIYENFGEAKTKMKELISELNLDENNFIKESYSNLIINNT